MPERIRRDNEARFERVGLSGLSMLSLGWMKLGMRCDLARMGVLGADLVEGGAYGY
jgi:hypothetical protein